MSDYTPEQDELLAVIQTAHREAWTDATEYADAPHIIRAAVVRWLAEHDREKRLEVIERVRALTRMFSTDDITPGAVRLIQRAMDEEAQR